VGVRVFNEPSSNGSGITSVSSFDEDDERLEVRLVVERAPMCEAKFTERMKASRRF
jgi:hypothetical protein